VSIEQDGASFDLAGIDDFRAIRHGRGHGADLDAALAGRDASRAVVLLAHQPRQARDAARADVVLQLSGHTHGGQIWPWHAAVRLQQGGLLAGHYQLGATQLYVSRGVGYVGPPVRVGAPAEITRVILRAAG
jgi:predicted MPP superfamily phosphohydrolase